MAVFATLVAGILGGTSSGGGGSANLNLDDSSLKQWESVLGNEVMMEYLIKIGSGVLIGYVLVLIIYIPLSRWFYKKKHAQAYYKTKHFKDGLSILEDMYQEEKTNGY